MSYLSELIGIILGDGNIYYNSKSRSYYVEITGNPLNENDYYFHISWLFLNIVGKPGRIYLGGRGLRIRIYDKKFVEFLINEMGMDYGESKCYSAKIPLRIIKASKQEILCCLRGIFDTDGSFFVSKKGGKLYPSIEIVSCSEKLAKQIKNLLIEDFRVNFRIKMSKKSNARLAYAFSLYGQEETNKWFKLVGSSNSAKYEKYENFIKRFK